MKVSRPGFMGLGLVSVSDLKGLVSVSRFKVSVSLETILSKPQDLKEEKYEKEAW